MFIYGQSVSCWNFYDSQYIILYYHFILASLDCPKDYQCGVGGTCVVDPYMPETIQCRCDKGYVKATDGKCVGTCVFTARTAT